MRYLFIILIFLASPAWASSARIYLQGLKLEKVIDGVTIKASGEIISLWGVKALTPKSPYSYAAKLFLESTMSNGRLSCDDMGKAGGHLIMRCFVDSADVGSLLVQMGMAMADNSYYQTEEANAQLALHGIWKHAVGKSL